MAARRFRAGLWLALGWFGAACGGSPEITLPVGYDALPDASVDASLDAMLDADSGGSLFDAADTGACVPPTCADLGADCGPVTDKKCGGVVACGACEGGSVCGAGGKPNVCGASTGSDAGVCTAKSCVDLGAECGKINDGCGTLIDCGACEAGTCGGGGAYRCGTSGGADGGSCTKLTCADQSIECGLAGDGCGGQIDCLGCPLAGDTCGGGGQSGKCGHPVCVKQTCGQQGVTCGTAGDGCGGTLACGGCKAPQSCGGDPARPGQCGCTGVCALVPTCTGGATTTLTGVVKDPAGAQPLYNVLVYVPNDPSDPALQTFPKGTTCDQCGATAAGDPLVTTYTKTDGTFSLAGVPVGSNITLAIQLGRWRRLFTVNVPNACQANVVTGTGHGGGAIAGGVLTMPKNKAQGNIPLMAVVTGAIDALECVLLDMGLDQAEFTNPSGNGRVHLYTGAGYWNRLSFPYGGGAIIDANTPTSAALVPVLSDYDLVVLSCQHYPFAVARDPTLGSYAKFVDYANGGGRLFASHYSYTYLQEGGAANPFYGTANWDPVEQGFTSTNATVDVDVAHNPKGPDFAAWLGNVGALTSTTPPQLTINDPRYNVASVVAPTQQWLTFSDPGAVAPLHFTFNTPVGAASASQCGRVLFSDFHVVTTGGYATTDVAFPGECSTAPMTAQEKVLEFMLFDLGACVQPYTPVCTPTSCDALGVGCGPAGDGCGGALDCGLCPSGEACGLGGPGKCGAPACAQLSCAAQGVECGYAGDGCGNLLTCPTCPAGQTCGAGGPGKCGATSSDGGACATLTCAAQGIECGQAGDGCGNAITCPPCPVGQTCGAGGPGKCGTPVCSPLTCLAQSIDCGPAGDGCGNELDCGNCKTGQVCGLGGPGKCGSVH